MKLRNSSIIAVEKRAGRFGCAVAMATILLLPLLAIPAAAQTYSVIHIFGNAGDGSFPGAGLTLRGGILYGTTSGGGNGAGTVFQLRRNGSGWVSTPLSFFSTGG